MDKFSGAEFAHATGTVAGGAHPTHHHHRPSGTGSFGAQSTGAFSFGKGNAKASGSFSGEGSAKPSGHAHGKGGAKPTGTFGAGSAMPTEARSFKAAEW